MKAIDPKKTLTTLVKLYSGNSCPHATECACRSSDWCPRSGNASSGEEQDYPMLHLAGCAMGHDRCCCRVLDEIELLAKAYLERAGVNRAPVPLELINLCDPRRPIELRPFPLKAYFGCAWFLGNEWVVHLNSNNEVEMNRFTAFHEGFHILCSTSGMSFSKVEDCYKPLSERLADYFAASILMPRHMVHEMWPKVKNIEEMALIFDVPEGVMEDWLIRLRLCERETHHAL
ncbi:MAG: ImmA/IrrE family metallo-endopeptidase [Chloroflexi bacterium]|jgi:hypothetical protein|nr:ImmA/IrrE family metallo-endopeptidase [Chloroflexota bacterium]